MRRFPGGVTDPEGRRGFVGLTGGQITALDLTTGAVIWSRPQLGQPLAVTPSRLLTVDDADGEVVLRLINAETGQEVARVLGLDLPSWARHVIREPDAARFYARNEGTGIRVSWSLRQPYRGGAPPGPTIAGAHPAAPITGSILLDPARGIVLEKGHGIPPADQPEISSAKPNVLAQERIGDRVYSLKVAPTSERRTTVTVEARGAASGEVEWEAPVGSVADVGPGPLRS
jgi:hypothetical protein